jgi:uncharacterized membrane protein YeaQ/YmgE (transglycosylase-associated protein family)
MIDLGRDATNTRRRTALVPANFRSKTPRYVDLKQSYLGFNRKNDIRRRPGMNILWIILIGFVAGIIAKLLAPGPNNPAGFILTTVLGVAGAFLATFIGQLIGWYRLDQGAGLIGATVGALIVLFIWHQVVSRRSV